MAFGITKYQVVKYLLEGAAIAVASKFILRNNASLIELGTLTLTITLTLVVLDLYAPQIAVGARQGAGFGMGLSIAGGQRGGMDDSIAVDYYSKDGHPTISQHGPPIMMIPEPSSHHIQQHTVSQMLNRPQPRHMHTHAPVNFNSQPDQVNVLERFMDDHTALQYYSSDRMDSSPSVHEFFQSKIINQPSQQVGGYDQESGVAATAPSAPPTSTPSNTSNQGVTVGERGLVYGKLRPRDALPTSAGEIADNTLVSGELITIADESGNKLVSNKGSNFVTIGTSDPVTGDKLFKLRVQLVNGHSNLKMVAIKPNIPVNLVYSDNMGVDHMINGNETLNVMASGGERDRAFIIEPTTAGEAQGVVNKEQSVVIKRALEGNLSSYLKVNENRIETTSNKANATTFKISSIKGCGPLWRFK